MGGRPSGDATVEEMESGEALLVDGGGCVVQGRVGRTVEGQDGRAGGSGVRTHPETGPRTPTRAIADGCRQRVLQPDVSGLDDASEDSSLGTLRSDDGGCLRRRAEVGNICLRISGSRRVRFPALAVLSETSKRSVCRLV